MPARLSVLVETSTKDIAKTKSKLKITFDLNLCLEKSVPILSKALHGIEHSVLTNWGTSHATDFCTINVVARS